MTRERQVGTCLAEGEGEEEAAEEEEAAAEESGLVWVGS
jgi:hypothetical protein